MVALCEREVFVLALTVHCEAFETDEKIQDLN